MLAQKTAAASSRSPRPCPQSDPGLTAAVPMITKRRLETIRNILQWICERRHPRERRRARRRVPRRFTANSQGRDGELSPMGRPSTSGHRRRRHVYLNDAATVTGHILYVDGGAHFGTGERTLSWPPLNDGESRLAQLRIQTARCANAFGAYVPAVQTGNLLFSAGCSPLRATP